MTRYIVEHVPHQYIGKWGGITIKKDGAKRFDSRQEAQERLDMMRNEHNWALPHARVMEIEEE